MVVAEKVRKGIPAAGLRYWRERKGMSQQMLADASGVHRVTINDIEQRGFARPSSVTKLAAALGVRPEDLREKPAEDAR